MNIKLFFTRNARAACRLGALFFTCFYTTGAWCQPDMRPSGPNIADKGSAFYHFRVSTLDSADGQRHYKIWTGIPNKKAPPAGFPVMYLLDGNAVMDRLSERLLQTLSAQNPPVIVAVGYQTTLPFDLAARTYDYTPPDGEKSARPGGRKGGGDAIFRRLLEEKIAPQAERGLKINSAGRGLWGHSLGGVFTLNAWLSSSFFHFYYPTSPTLNRQYDGVLAKLAKVEASRFCAKSLYVSEGDGQPGNNPHAPAAEVQDRVRATLASLRQAGLSAAYWSWPELSHGQTFDAGFRQALRHLAQHGEERGACRQAE
ncbi:alpha/beta hydrolase [Erwinia sp. PsM31]|uniref:alpha/beta hydrolase n=1 Tax=Erwinia sp. PsM31 TaxID=3030535 RepID=UPI00263A878E|nr:alpha/beta hydrolase-fold protein [Erwinia sp. PsM31]MDN4625468.1 alpha/beta hydrolase-fold protein [Erwinia sp. PsM31]